MKNRVLAGSEAKHPLQESDALAHRGRGRKRAEKVVASIRGSTEETETRSLVSRNDDVRIGFVVAKQDVVTRRQTLDQVVLEQQRLAFRARHGRFDPRDLAHHQGNARA